MEIPIRIDGPVRLALALGGSAARAALPAGGCRVVSLGDAGAGSAGASVIGEAEDLPFRAAAFDAAACDQALRRAADPESLLAELVRVVRPGGALWLRERVAERDPARLQAAERRLRRADPAHRRTLSMEELSAHVAGELLGVEAHATSRSEGEGTVAIWSLRVSP